jgi:nitroreductase
MPSGDWKVNGTVRHWHKLERKLTASRGLEMRPSDGPIKAVEGMDFFHLVQARHSIRALSARPVEPEKVHRILEAVNCAPSAGNLQAYEIISVTDPRILHALGQSAFGQDFIELAPLTFVFCANPGRSASRYGQRGALRYCVQDATIGCAYAQLAATAVGLASVWVGAFDDVAVGSVLRLNPDWMPIAILPIGYPNETPVPTSRRSLESLVHSIGGAFSE